MYRIYFFVFKTLALLFPTDSSPPGTWASPHSLSFLFPPAGPAHLPPCGLRTLLSVSRSWACSHWLPWYSLPPHVSKLCPVLSSSQSSASSAVTRVLHCTLDVVSVLQKSQGCDWCRSYLGTSLLHSQSCSPHQLTLNKHILCSTPSFKWPPFSFSKKNVLFISIFMYT